MYIGFTTHDVIRHSHLTVLYTGDLTPQGQGLAIRLLTELAPVRMLVEPLRVNMFGVNKDIPVLEVKVPKILHLIRNHLVDSGLPNPTGFEWSPHITLPDPLHHIDIDGAFEVKNLKLLGTNKNGN